MYEENRILDKEDEEAWIAVCPICSSVLICGSINKRSLQEAGNICEGYRNQHKVWGNDWLYISEGIEHEPTNMNIINISIDAYKKLKWPNLSK